jgi:hypothetical protein
MKAPATPVKRLALSFEAAHLCLENAQGFRKDAKHTSVETALALLELSMEECAKGIILIFDNKFEAEGFDPNSAESLAKVKDHELRALFERHREILTASQVRNAFRWHWVKLRQLQFALDFISYQLRHGLAEQAVREILSKPEYPLGLQIRVALLPRKNRTAAITVATQEAIDRINRIDLATLDQKKNAALYVGLASDEKSCVFPSVDMDLLDEVEDATDYLIQLLDGMLLSGQFRP